MENNFEFIGFIPHRLEIPDRPDLNVFPFNVLFVAKIYHGIRTAEYLPDLGSYKSEGQKASLRYRNSADQGYSLVITHDRTTGDYEGVRYRGEEIISITHGREWRGFFTHLAMMGIIGYPEGQYRENTSAQVIGDPRMPDVSPDKADEYLRQTFGVTDEEMEELKRQHQQDERVRLNLIKI